jgi:hypothetical protein
MAGAMYWGKESKEKSDVSGGGLSPRRLDYGLPFPRMRLSAYPCAPGEARKNEK